MKAYRWTLEQLLKFVHAKEGRLARVTDLGVPMIQGWMDDMAGRVYGKRIGYPTLKPHDIRHGVAMEVLGQRNNLEGVRAPLGHACIDPTQIYTMIRPPQLNQAVGFFETQALKVQGE